MIISVSRRTDIPACHADWFFRRLQEGFVLVRHPMNPRRVSRVCLSPEVVDGFVFWTKNPLPMLERLSLLKAYAYYFQFTLTPYGRDAEPGLPSKRDVLIPAFRKLSSLLGRHRVIWRYDPVFLSRTYTFEYHVRWFERLAALLAPCTEKCVISFLDFYRDTRSSMASLGLRDFPPEMQENLVGKLADAAHAYGLRVESCAENMDLSRFGIAHGRCVDAELIGRIGDASLKAKRDGNQRPACGCAESIDIGAYGSCRHGCLYCYAGTGRAVDEGQNPDSPLLIGTLHREDVVTDRVMRSCAQRQRHLSLLD